MIRLSLGRGTQRQVLRLIRRSLSLSRLVPANSDESFHLELISSRPQLCIILSGSFQSPGVEEIEQLPENGCCYVRDINTSQRNIFFQVDGIDPGAQNGTSGSDDSTVSSNHLSGDQELDVSEEAIAGCCPQLVGHQRIEELVIEILGE